MPKHLGKSTSLPLARRIATELSQTFPRSQRDRDHNKAFVAADILFRGVLQEWAKQRIEQLADAGVAPSLLVAHYHGVQVLSRKTIAVAVPECSGDVWANHADLSAIWRDCQACATHGAMPQDVHRFLVESYELQQNHSNYTLNAVMAAKTRNSGSEEPQSIVCSWDDNSRMALNDKLGHYSLNLHARVVAYLLGKETLVKLASQIRRDRDSPEFVNAREALKSERHAFARFVDYAPRICLESCQTKLINAERSFREGVSTYLSSHGSGDPQRCTLAHQRRHAVACLMAEQSGYTPECEGLLRLCKDVWKNLIAPGLASDSRQVIANRELREEDINAAVRLLQGICAYASYGNYVVVLSLPVANVLPRAIGNVSWCCLNDPRKYVEDGIHVCWESLDSIVNKVPAEYCKPRDVDPDEPSLELNKVISDDLMVKAVRKSLKRTNLSESHLAACLRLAEVFRPEAVHEKHEIEMTLCLATQHECEKLLRVEGEDLSGRLHWLPCDVESAKRIAELDDENEAKERIVDDVNVCKAHIKGNHGLLTGSGKLLFVDNMATQPAVSRIARIAADPITGAKRSPREASQLGRDICFIRVRGRSRAELIHGGKTVLSWIDARASWVEPPQWDAESLCRYLSAALYPNGSDESILRQLRFVGDCAMRISEEGGGAAFLFTSSLWGAVERFMGQMTHPVGMGELDLAFFASRKDTDGFIGVVKQDGGTAVCLRGGGDGRSLIGYPRRQFLPWRDGKVPFHIWNSGLEPLWRKRHSPLHWREWYDVLHWGTRHLSTLSMSACLCGQSDGLGGARLPDVVGICISSDGPVRVFDRGIAVDPQAIGSGRFNLVEAISKGDPDITSASQRIRRWREAAQEALCGKEPHRGRGRAR